MRIALVTDAWQPQVNGVVRTYEYTTRELERLGHQVLVVNPSDFNTLPCPTYPSIRLALFPRRALSRRLAAFTPDAVHVATEGPLGQAARAHCRARGMPFTTSFHTRFPEYIRMRAPIPVSWTYAWLRRFHGAARRTFAPTRSQCDFLVEKGFSNVVLWPRGVDTSLFRPGSRGIPGMARPIFIYVGRVAVEKNLESFLRLDLPGSKLVVGDGPDLDFLKRRYPSARFTGFRFGRELAETVAAADVFVFPSLTDTFGIVLLEAMACGVPVAAFPVTGPRDVVRNGVTGVLSDDLRQAALDALNLDPADCIAYASSQSWRDCAETFVDNLCWIGEARGLPSGDGTLARGG